MSFNFKTAKQKKALIAGGVSLVALAVCFTIAFFGDSLPFHNIFGLNGRSVEEYVDTFTSPNDWSPCQEIPKTATAQNKNESVRYARMKIDEYWRLKQSQIVDPDDHTTTELPLTWDDNGTTKSYAIINTQNDNDWELRSDGWYYYKTPLRQNDITNSLLKSVTLNCEAILVNGVTYSQDGKTGESVPSDYAGATYHVYVTMQLSDVEWEVARETLYDYIASRTRGLDTEISFNDTALASHSGETDWNGNGVNTLSAHANDEYPVYYYRGEVTNNTVIFGNYCWRILRTAEGGATKIIYAGEKTANNTCQSYSDTAYAINNGAEIKYSTEPSMPSMPDGEHIFVTDFGYSYNPQVTTDYLFRKDTYNYFGNDEWPNTAHSDTVTFDGTYYHLVNPQNGSAMYSYFCTKNSYFDNVSTPVKCEKVVYKLVTDNNGYTGIAFSKGATVDDFLPALQTNVVSSNLKTTIESWYQTNIANTDEANKVADVIYCNDRHATRGITVPNGWYPQHLFDSYVRITGMDTNLSHPAPHPSIDCTDAPDRFTVGNSGNEKLAYPVATITADEAQLAGYGYAGGYFWNQPQGVLATSDNYLYSGYGDFWTMSPSHLYDNDAMITKVTSSCLNAQFTYDETVVRPVLALIHDTYIKSGTGTLADPFILEW